MSLCVLERVCDVPAHSGMTASNGGVRGVTDSGGGGGGGRNVAPCRDEK